MHVFGTVCFAQVQSPKKLDPRNEQGIFIGYDKESPAFFVYFRETGKVRKVRCVKFTDKYENIEPNEDDWFRRNIPSENDVPQQTNDAERRTDDVPVQEQEQEQEQEQKQEQKPVTKDGNRRYPSRERRKPKRYDDYVLDESAKYTVDYCFRVADVPKTYTDAMRSVESDKWQSAMEEEINALTENDTFEFMSVPEDRKVVGGRWVYNVKVGPNTEEQYKTRYVAKGYSQLADIDYQETFSPTARITSVRTLLQLAVQEDMIVHQMDVKTAYLNAPIDCEIFMEQPEGFVKTDENGANYLQLKSPQRNWRALKKSISNFFIKPIYS